MAGAQDSSVGAPPPSDSSPEFVAKEVSGSHVITIKGYSLTKKLPTRDMITAATFNAAGHRWSILYYPNDTTYDDSQFISLYLMKIDPNHGHDTMAQFSFSLLSVDGVPVPQHSNTSGAP
ncbi:hypothetical protein HU200_048950 [Digitaria exilis]|uniref:MATH domain-containing protein n=1 Tax=Digitaria exilis TaxID=1010633 RepID=A0A835AV08_9POAL|nr:hypothetical protein HU200_048950 [Digitaria exilis]